MDNNLIELTHIKEIISLIPGNVFWKGIDRKFLGCNNNVAKILNLSSRDDIIGKTNQDLFDLELAKAAEQIDLEVIINNCEIVSEEEGIDLNGQQAVYFTRKIPLHDKDGNVNGILGISIDITDRKRIERELRIAKEQADIANQAKTEFLANMSHDLRTPFSGILSINDYLASTETEQNRKELLQDSVQSAKQLLVLLNEILDVCNMETGVSKIRKSTFNLSNLLDSIEALIKAEIKQKNLKFVIVYQDNIPDEIYTDKIRLHRIILNLVGNAIKFTDSGQINISVQIQPNNGTDTLILIIKDTGIGMPNDKLNTIFERFSRLTSSYQGRYPGMGIGLHIVNTFVNELGGKIKVSSEVGKGTSFTCLIPLTS